MKRVLGDNVLALIVADPDFIPDTTVHMVNQSPPGMITEYTVKSNL